MGKRGEKNHGGKEEESPRELNEKRGNPETARVCMRRGTLLEKSTRKGGEKTRTKDQHRKNADNERSHPGRKEDV